MGKFDGILLCTDLDGTLYRNDKSVSKENREAIEYFKREGGFFTFITGRMPSYSIEAYRAASPNVPFGCANGGALYDYAAQKYIWACELPPYFVETVRYVDQTFPSIGIHANGLYNVYFCRDNESTATFRKLTGIPHLVRRYDEIEEPIAKIIFSSEDQAQISAMEQALRAYPPAEAFDFVRSERTLFELMPKGIHKGVALAKLTEYLGVDPAKTIAIGDYDNDIGMLQTAGLGVAVANASAAALAAADTVTVSNEQHAIAQVICGLESGKYTLA